MTLSHTATGVFHEINTYTSSGQTARIRLFYKHTPTSYILKLDECPVASMDEETFLPCG